MATTLERVINITEKFLQIRGHPDDDFVVTASSAVCQDAYIYGVDVDDYVDEMEGEFGDVVWIIPWLRFTDQAAAFRGWGILIFPFWLVGRIASWPFHMGRIIPAPDPRTFGHRLEFEHIAKVIDAGQWSEP